MTGTSASGYRCLITDHEPWSKPHLSSNCTSVLLTKSLVNCANCGLPGAGYCTSKSSCGNPPKSCIVTGFSIAVTYVPLVSQCAEITSIAFGFSIVWDKLRKPWTNSFSSIAFIGLPWPRNNTGILEVSESSSVNLFKLLSFAIEPVRGSAAAAAKNCFLFMSSIFLPLFYSIICIASILEWTMCKMRVNLERTIFHKVVVQISFNKQSRCYVFSEERYGN